MKWILSKELKLREGMERSRGRLLDRSWFSGYGTPVETCFGPKKRERLCAAYQGVLGVNGAVHGEEGRKGSRAHVGDRECWSVSLALLCDGAGSWCTCGEMEGKTMMREGGTVTGRD